MKGSLRQNQLPKSGIAPQLVSHLKQCAIALVKPESRANGLDHQQTIPDAVSPKAARPKIDKSVLTFGEPKRIRCKEHLRFVASHPCLICGRSPSYAHHVRYAQSKGLNLKVSDEFTVPLCAIHHHHIHTTGKEREWWQERNIDPLKVSRELWQKSAESLPREAHLPEVSNDRVYQGQANARASDHDSEPAAEAEGAFDTSNNANPKS